MPFTEGLVSPVSKRDRPGHQQFECSQRGHVVSGETVIRDPVANVDEVLVFSGGPSVDLSHLTRAGDETCAAHQASFSSKLARKPARTTPRAIVTAVSAASRVAIEQPDQSQHSASTHAHRTLCSVQA